MDLDNLLVVLDNLAGEQQTIKEFSGQDIDPEVLCDPRSLEQCLQQNLSPGALFLVFPFLSWGYPAGWFIMKNPSKMEDLGLPPILGKL